MADRDTDSLGGGFDPLAVEGRPETDRSLADALADFDDEPVEALADDANGADDEQPDDDRDDENSDDESEDADEDGEVEDEPETAHDDTPLPVGMSEADRAMFAQLTPEAKAWMSQRATEQQRFVTQRSQEIAQARQQSERLANDLMQRLHAYDQHLAKFEAGPELPDVRLKDEDPLAYQDQLDAYLRGRVQQEAAAKERARIQQEAAAIQAQQLREMQAHEFRQLQQIAPDIAGNQQTMRELVEYARSLSIPADAMERATANEWVILNKARMFDQAQKAGEKVKAKQQARKEPPPKTVKPGPARTNGKSRTRAEDRFRRNPSADTLADLL